MYVPQEKPFEPNKEIEWEDEREKNEFWETVDRGLDVALEQLEKVINQQRGSFLKTYAVFVRGILRCGDLEIFPMTDDDRYGQSSFSNL